MNKIFEFILPVRTFSPNQSMHWRIKSKKHKLQKIAFDLIFRAQQPNIDLPCFVSLTRIAPRSLDEEDNLRMAMKYLKDLIADYIIPGKAPGRADDSKQIKWIYDQEKGLPKQYLVNIKIFH